MKSDNAPLYSEGRGGISPESIRKIIVLRKGRGPNHIPANTLLLCSSLLLLSFLWSLWTVLQIQPRIFSLLSDIRTRRQTYEAVTDFKAIFIQQNKTTCATIQAKERVKGRKVMQHCLGASTFKLGFDGMKC